jgi:hypothetical protein
MSLSLKRGLLSEQSWGVFWHILINFNTQFSKLKGKESVSVIGIF